MSQALAKKKENKSSPSKTRATREKLSRPNRSSQLSLIAHVLQRKSSCACGGNCPRCKFQDKSYPVINEDDRLEKEADQAATKVINTPDKHQKVTKQACNEKPVSKPQTFTRPVRQSITPVVAKKVTRLLSCENQGAEKEEKDIEEFEGSSYSLGNAGESFSDSARAYFEPRFGQNFSHVRIHRDKSAADFSENFHAQAFTLGHHIFFGNQQYQPDTAKGRKLIAHELTHVTQQAQLYSKSFIQREVDEEPQREHYLDLAESLSIQQFFGNVSQGIRFLIHNARSLYDTYIHSSHRPYTRLTCARLLIGIYRVLRERAATAPRDDQNVLQYRSVRGLVPWSSGNPTRIEDIPANDNPTNETRIFSQDNFVEWLNVVARSRPVHPSVSATQRPQPRAQARRRQTASPSQAPAEEVQETNEQEEAAETSEQIRPLQIGTSLQAQRNRPGEELSGGNIAGGTEIQNGIARLQRTRLRTATQAIAQHYSNVLEHEAQSQAEQVADISLLSAAGLIFYIGRGRLYVLDRSGHILGENANFVFDLGRIRHLDPGTYFLADYSIDDFPARILLQTLGSNGVDVSAIHVRLYGEQWGAGERQLDVRVLRVRAFREVMRGAGPNAGIGVIVSQNARRPLNTRISLLSVNPHRVYQAWCSVFTGPEYIRWALASNLDDLWRNFWSRIGEAVQGAIIESIIEQIPGGNVYMMMMQGTQLTGWLGMVSSIAGFGTRDEMHLASQYIARSVINFIIEELIFEGGARRVLAPIGSGTLRITTGQATSSYATMQEEVNQQTFMGQFNSWLFNALRRLFSNNQTSSTVAAEQNVDSPEALEQAASPEGSPIDPGQPLSAHAQSSTSSAVSPQPVSLPPARPQRPAPERQETPLSEAYRPGSQPAVPARPTTAQEALNEPMLPQGSNQPSFVPLPEAPPIPDTTPSRIPTSENQALRGSGYGHGRLGSSGASDPFSIGRERAFRHRPNFDPHADVLNVDLSNIDADVVEGGRGEGSFLMSGGTGRVHMAIPRGGRGQVTQEASHTETEAPAPTPTPPSTPTQYPETLTPEMLEHPHIGVPPAMQLNLAPRTPTTTATQATRSRRPDQPPPLSEFNLPEWSESTLNIIRRGFNIARFLDDDGRPLRGYVRGQRQMREHFARLQDLRDNIPDTTSRREMRIIREALSLVDHLLQAEQAMADNMRTRDQELQELERNYRQESTNSSDRPFNTTEGYRQWSNEWVGEFFQLSQTIVELNERIDNLIDRPILAWLNSERHNERFRRGSRGVVNLGSDITGEVLDSEMDFRDWSHGTTFDPQSSSERGMREPIESGHEVNMDPAERQPVPSGAPDAWSPRFNENGQIESITDPYGNTWTHLAEENQWRVNLSEPGQRHITQGLRINLTDYLRMSPIQLATNIIETLRERIRRSYLIVDHEGYLVRRTPPEFPEHAEDIQFMASQVYNVQQINIEWIFVPSINAWALRDTTAPEGEVLCYVNLDGEMIYPDQQ